MSSNGPTRGALPSRIRLSAKVALALNAGGPTPRRMPIDGFGTAGSCAEPLNVMYCRNVNGVAGLPSGSAAGLVLKNAPDRQRRARRPRTEARAAVGCREEEQLVVDAAVTVQVDEDHERREIVDARSGVEVAVGEGSDHQR
jgi:hypothetical protein